MIKNLLKTARVAGSTETNHRVEQNMPKRTVCNLVLRTRKVGRFCTYTDTKKNKVCMLFRVVVGMSMYMPIWRALL